MKKQCTYSARQLVTALSLDAVAVEQPNGVKILCPFHAESNPSCSVRDYDDGVGFKCFGCGKTGTGRDLIAAIHGDLTEAGMIELEEAIAKEPAATADASATNRQSAPPVSASVFHEGATALLSMSRLSDNDAAAAYMKGRGMFERALEEGWGALPSTPGAIQALTRELGPDTSRMLGLETEKGLRYGGHQLLIPWRDVDGFVVTIQRRTVDARAIDKKYIFPQGVAARMPYGVDRLRGAVALAITEGAMDTIAMRELCVREGLVRDVIGLPGAQGWNKGWGSFVAGREVILALDNDAAGDKASATLARELHAAGASKVVRRVPKGGKDWASLLETKEQA